jgi:hypothetical protein
MPRPRLRRYEFQFRRAWSLWKRFSQMHMQAVQQVVLQELQASASQVVQAREVAHAAALATQQSTLRSKDEEMAAALQAKAEETTKVRRTRTIRTAQCAASQRCADRGLALRLRFAQALAEKGAELEQQLQLIHSAHAAQVSWQTRRRRVTAQQQLTHSTRAARAARAARAVHTPVPGPRRSKS